MKLEQYQIIHSNKLIAEFMGLETATFIPSGHLNYYHREFDSGTWYEVHELSYNLSWDWLMPVVGKLLDQDEFYGASDHSYRLKDALVETNIDSMYKIVVEFINKCNWKSNMNDNKVIAEFMGDYDYNIEGAIPYGDFTNSWDWLMPVVKKCIDIYHIELKNDDLSFKFYDCIGNKERTYNTVVRFIKNNKTI